MTCKTCQGDRYINKCANSPDVPCPDCNDPAIDGIISAKMINVATLTGTERVDWPMNARVTDISGQIKKMRTVLEHAKQKLQLYREAHSGEYVGGVEYTQLIAEIDEALATPKPFKFAGGTGGLGNPEHGSEAIIPLKRINPPSSFPYLRIAKRFNIPYAVVLWVADRHDERWPSYDPMPYHIARDFPSNSMRWDSEPWATAISAAWQIERVRRFEQRNETR